MFNFLIFDMKVFNNIYFYLHYFLIVIIAIFIMFSSKWYVKKEVDTKDYLRRIGLYVLWAFVQNFLLFLFFNFIHLYFNTVFSIIVSVFIFSFVIHYPNILLMISTFALSFINFYFYFLHRDFYICVFAHSLLASTLFVFYPEEIHKNFYVLFSFFRVYKK